MVDVEHNEAAHRFEAVVEGERGVLDYQRDGDRVTMTHVVVPPAIGGRGIAAALTSTALDWARGASLRVEPRCPYVAAYIDKHPEYADLVG